MEKFFLTKVYILLYNYMKYTKETEVLIAKSYEQGKSMRQLAKEFQCSKRTISNILKRNNCKPRKVGVPYRGGKQNVSGYTYVRVPSESCYHVMVNSTGYVAQHRLVMAKHLKRPLKKHETVHHLDGNRSNNSIKNLQIRSSSHGTGVVHVCINCGSKNIRSIELSA